jgi:hypothetical protein
MNLQLIAFISLIFCFAAQALAGDPDLQNEPNVVANPSPMPTMSEKSGSGWLTRQSADLLDIIRILYKGRESEVQRLEESQADWNPRKQIEKRIALIKESLLEH